MSKIKELAELILPGGGLYQCSVYDEDARRLAKAVLVMHEALEFYEETLLYIKGKEARNALAEAEKIASEK